MTATQPKPDYGAEIRFSLSSMQEDIKDIKTAIRHLERVVMGNIDSQGELPMLAQVVMLNNRISRLEQREAENRQVANEFVALKNRILGAAAVLSLISAGIGGAIANLFN